MGVGVPEATVHRPSRHITRLVRQLHVNANLVWCLRSKYQNGVILNEVKDLLFVSVGSEVMCCKYAAKFRDRILARQGVIGRDRFLSRRVF